MSHEFLLFSKKSFEIAFVCVCSAEWNMKKILLYTFRGLYLCFFSYLLLIFSITYGQASLFWFAKHVKRRERMGRSPLLTAQIGLSHFTIPSLI